MKIPSVLIEIRHSRMLKGQVGLFAVREMKVGFEIVTGASFQETFEPWTTYELMDDRTRRKVDAFCVSTPSGFWMPADFNLLPVSYFMNHSCTPNVVFNKEEGFVLWRSVEEGEELCWDYATGYSNPRFRLDCQCGSPTCRKSITGNDWMLPDLQNRYQGCFLPYLQETINLHKERKTL